jgi:hypothetical protein
MASQTVPSVPQNFSTPNQTAHFSRCNWEYPESTPGACDAESCGNLSNVIDLKSGREFCSKHFRTLELERELEALSV